MLFGLTEAAYQGAGIDGGWEVNFAANWYFIAGLLLLYLPVIWFVTDRIIEPRLGKWSPEEGADAQSYSDEDVPLAPEQKKGLLYAGLALLAVCALWAVMTLIPNAPLWYDDAELTLKYQATGLPMEDVLNKVEAAAWYDHMAPFFRSMVAAFLILFLAAGWAYGAAANTINNHKDLVDMMAEAMKDMGYYLVLAFAAAHFVAMFNWSNLGLILSLIHI